jgi:hypothetical protein
MNLDLLTNATVVDDAISHYNGDNCDNEKQEPISNYQAEEEPITTNEVF